MTDNLVLDHISDDVAYVRGRVDNVTEQVSALRTIVEHRLTKLEVRAGIIALFVSAVVAAVGAAAR